MPSLDPRPRPARRLTPPPTRTARWVVNEYPVGYVAQLARPRSAKSRPAERRASSGRYTRSGSGLSPAA